MAPRETENNAYAKFWSDQQRVLWYVMVFSVLVNSQWPKQAFMNQLYAELYGNKTVTVLQNLSTKTEQFFK